MPTRIGCLYCLWLKWHSFSRNIFTDISRNDVLSAVWVSLSPVKLTYEVNITELWSNFRENAMQPNPYCNLIWLGNGILEFGIQSKWSRCMCPSMCMCGTHIHKHQGTFSERIYKGTKGKILSISLKWGHTHQPLFLEMESDLYIQIHTLFQMSLEVFL